MTLISPTQIIPGKEKELIVTDTNWVTVDFKDSPIVITYTTDLNINIGNTSTGKPLIITLAPTKGNLKVNINVLGKHFSFAENLETINGYLKTSSDRVKLTISYSESIGFLIEAKHFLYFPQVMENTLGLQLNMYGKTGTNIGYNIGFHLIEGQVAWGDNTYDNAVPDQGLYHEYTPEFLSSIPIEEEVHYEITLENLKSILKFDTSKAPVGGISCLSDATKGYGWFGWDDQAPLGYGFYAKRHGSVPMGVCLYQNGNWLETELDNTELDASELVFVSGDYNEFMTMHVMKQIVYVNIFNAVFCDNPGGVPGILSFPDVIDGSGTLNIYGDNTGNPNLFEGFHLPGGWYKFKLKGVIPGNVYENYLDSMTGIKKLIIDRSFMGYNNEGRVLLSTISNCLSLEELRFNIRDSDIDNKWIRVNNYFLAGTKIKDPFIDFASKDYTIVSEYRTRALAWFNGVGDTYIANLRGTGTDTLFQSNFDNLELYNVYMGTGFLSNSTIRGKLKIILGGGIEGNRLIGLEAQYIEVSTLFDSLTHLYSDNILSNLKGEISIDFPKLEEIQGINFLTNNPTITKFDFNFPKLKNISNGALMNNPALSFVHLDKLINLTTIGTNFLAGCSNLEHIDIGKKDWSTVTVGAISTPITTSPVTVYAETETLFNAFKAKLIAPSLTLIYGGKFTG